MTLGQKVMWLNENYINYNVRLDICGTDETFLNAFVTKPEIECDNIDIKVCDYYKQMLCNKGIDAVKFIERLFNYEYERKN
jgi:hypothetical protein